MNKKSTRQEAKKDINNRLDDMHKDEDEFKKYVEFRTGILFDDFVSNLERMFNSIKSKGDKL